ncbi:MAG: phosphatidate cytidylyltransferase [Chitinophagales bacterium]
MDFKKLATRAGSALIFVIIMVGCTLFQASYIVLMALLTAFCTHEYMEVTGVLREENKRFGYLYRLIAIGTNVLAFLLSASIIVWQMDSRFLSLIPVLLFIVFIIELYAKSEKPFINIAVNLSSFVYVGIPFALLNLIVFYGGRYEPFILIGVMVLIWVYDAGAYLVGSLFGQRPLFKRISPNKTLEGSLGGALILTALGFGLGYIAYFDAFSPLQWIIISLLVAYFSATGDLIQSMLKRSLGIKDTGNIMPGHGGFLDRFDAFIFVIPFIAFYIVCFKH